ncbi:MAG TPA: hypothetical protein VNS32_06195 [Flavisolibacter sp.]|nr:hypothetical protein [Flavisolibacter sp.]
MSKTNNIKKEKVVQCIQYLENTLPAEEGIVIPAQIFQNIKETIIMMEDEAPYQKGDDQ